MGSGDGITLGIQVVLVGYLSSYLCVVCLAFQCFASVMCCFIKLPPFHMKKMSDAESMHGGHAEREKVMNEGQEKVILAVSGGAWSILV